MTQTKKWAAAGDDIIVCQERQKKISKQIGANSEQRTVRTEDEKGRARQSFPFLT